jgi:hypothetical protein
VGVIDDLVRNFVRDDGSGGQDRKKMNGQGAAQGVGCARGGRGLGFAHVHFMDFKHLVSRVHGPMTVADVAMRGVSTLSFSGVCSDHSLVQGTEGSG